MNVGVAVSLGALSLIALLLGTLLLLRYRRDHLRWHLYWSVGILLTFVTLAQEAALFAGAWSQPMVRSYLVLVAVLVGVLSLGSAELALARRWRNVWFGFVGVASAACVVLGAGTPVPSSILVGGVVTGAPPVGPLIASSVLTFPSALLLIGASAYGAIRQKRPRLLFITAGTAILALAGSLYLVSFPATLYYAEFVAVVLLFLGFVNVVERPTATAEAVPA